LCARDIEQREKKKEEHARHCESTSTMMILRKRVRVCVDERSALKEKEFISEFKFNLFFDLTRKVVH